MIGAAGGLAFVMINSGELPTPLEWIARVIGVLIAGFVVWRVIAGSGRPDSGPPPSRNAMRVYWACVLAEVVAIPLGAAVITNVIGRPELVVLWVVFIVGAHFLPFVKAFNAPLFLLLGWALIGLAVVGAIVALLAWPTAPAATATLAGFVLLAFSAAGVVDRSEAEPHPDSSAAGAG